MLVVAFATEWGVFAPLSGVSKPPASEALRNRSGVVRAAIESVEQKKARAFNFDCNVLVEKIKND